MEKAVIYLRVSTEKQTEQSQLSACKKLCEERGWEIVGVFADHGKSAYHNVTRPQYEDSLLPGGGMAFSYLCGILYSSAIVPGPIRPSIWPNESKKLD